MKSHHQLTTSDNIRMHLEVEGHGSPLLLLHGYPQTHVMWHKIRPILAEKYTLIMPDLKGYGRSDKPLGLPDHSNYSKRRSALDQVEVMEQLGFKEFLLAGHDRGARVAHRLALDFPQRVQKMALLDILPTYEIFQTVDKDIASDIFHWFFLIQKDNFPEALIGSNPTYYYTEILRRWSGSGLDIFPPEALEHYLHSASSTEAIHASCEDYRAAATVDLIHDESDINKKLTCPLWVMWSKEGFLERRFNVLKEWQKWDERVDGLPLSCGHFLAEEKPKEVAHYLINWFSFRRSN